eukprot:3364723-Rhodomonas_salina.1
MSSGLTRAAESTTPLKKSVEWREQLSWNWTPGACPGRGHLPYSEQKYDELRVVRQCQESEFSTMLVFPRSGFCCSTRENFEPGGNTGVAAAAAHWHAVLSSRLL